MNQLQRDIRAIRTVLPEDGSPITLGDILLRCGENLGGAIGEMVNTGEIVPVMIGHRHAYQSGKAA